jgi:hypothetical protein
LTVSVDDQYFIEEEEEEAEEGQGGEDGNEDDGDETGDEEATCEEESRTESHLQRSLSGGSETDEYVLVVDENGDSHFQRSSHDEFDHTSSEHGAHTPVTDLSQELRYDQDADNRQQTTESESQDEEEEKEECPQQSLPLADFVEDQSRVRASSDESSAQSIDEQGEHFPLQKIDVFTAPLPLAYPADDYHFLEASPEIMSRSTKTNEIASPTQKHILVSERPHTLSNELTFVDIETVLHQLSAIKTKTTEERELRQVFPLALIPLTSYRRINLKEGLRLGKKSFCAYRRLLQQSGSSFLHQRIIICLKQKFLHFLDGWIRMIIPPSLILCSQEMLKNQSSLITLPYQQQRRPRSKDLTEDCKK